MAVGRRALIVRAVLSAAVILVGASVFWGVEQRNLATETARELDAALATTRAMRDSLRISGVHLTSLEHLVSFWSSQTSSARQNQGMLLNDYDIEWLREKGLTDPVGDLRRDLMAHPELIPINATPGVAMRFEYDSIAILSTRWVYAAFEDGHSGARCPLSYHVEPGGQISWKYIAEMPYVE